MRRLLAVAVLAVFATTQLGCYTTRIASGMPAGSQTYEERQWFAIAGLIPLSGAAGNECRNGLATAESQYNVVDALLILGLTAVGGIVGGVACGGSGDPAQIAQCAGGAANLVPLLIQPRTVRYTCVGGAATGAVMPVPAPAPASTSAVSQQ